VNSELRSTQRGFTLIELMITTTVAAIMLVASIPSFSAYIAFQRTSTAAQNALRDVVAARAESARTGLSSVLVPVADDWRGGWSVLRSEIAEDGSAREVHVADRDLAEAGLETAVCTTDGSSVSRVEFDAIGGLRTPAAGVVLQFRAKLHGFESVREVHIAPSGRAHVLRGDEHTAELTCA
jgi:prepilin-type N-terminal cleavage/methylation domain-containing protein